MKDAVIILCGGGPAPGMNSVSMSVAKTFITKKDPRNGDHIRNNS